MPKKISPQELVTLLQSDESYALIDVRNRNEYSDGQIFSATHIPRSALEFRMPLSVPVKNTKIILYSNNSYRSVLAANTLEKYGYSNVFYLDGGLTAWQAAGNPLVEGVHVLSKSFGEIVGEIGDHVTTISPEELKQWMDNKEDVIVIEIRPFAESSKTGSIPGAICAPGVELPLRIADYAGKDRKIVNTCAGRTRGFISNATLKLMGFEVYDLNNGTMGWQLAGYELEKGFSLAPPPSVESRKVADTFAERLAKEHDIQFISVEKLKSMQEQAHDKTLYLMDVRSPDEYQIIGHIPGSISVEGGQAIQNTDDAAPVRNANIVFVCDNGTRSIITAYWYQQMGFPNVYVLKEGLSAWIGCGEKLERSKMQVTALGFNETVVKVGKIEPPALKEMLEQKQDTVVIQLDESKIFALGHIDGAHWIPRGWLEKRIGDVVASKETPVVVTCKNGSLSILAADTLLEMGYKKVSALNGGIKAWEKAGFTLKTGLEGMEPDDIFIHLTEYGLKEAKAYFEWEEALVHLSEYMDYFKQKGILQKYSGTN